jgi:subtilisin family serine protease
MSGSVAGADMKAYTAWNTKNNGTIDPNLTPAQIIGFGNYGDPSVEVALVDYGVYSGHPDFATSPAGDAGGPAILQGINYTGVGGAADTSDSSSDGHGTHMAGIIAARRVDSPNPLAKKVVGVAPRCKILPLKINTDTFSATQAENAIREVITRRNNNPAKRYVLCIGWTCGDNPQVRQAITDLWNNGNGRCAIVCAAGQVSGGGASTPSFPAKHPNAISVGAFVNNDTRWVDSNSGNNEAGEATIFAPGYNIRSTGKTNNWPDMNGTSMAAAFIAGAAALLWSRALIGNPNLTAAQIKDKIRTNTDPLGTTGFARHNLQEAAATITR